MSKHDYNTKEDKKFTHLDFTERKLIEKWLNQRITIAEIAKRLGRNRSTIYREIK
ncbi:MAG TPA: helix-turn-helix domain-containing protein [Tepidimicrobium sp.]|nr:helix-turn-helix domain-containing protein [Tepidimicrobium sp.]